MGASLLREGVLRVPQGDSEWLPGRRGRVAWRTGTGCVAGHTGPAVPTDELLGLRPA